VVNVTDEQHTSLLHHLLGYTLPPKTDQAETHMEWESNGANLDRYEFNPVRLRHGAANCGGSFGEKLFTAQGKMNLPLEWILTLSWSTIWDVFKLCINFLNINPRRLKEWLPIVASMVSLRFGKFLSRLAIDSSLSIVVSITFGMKSLSRHNICSYPICLFVESYDEGSRSTSELKACRQSENH
jgi:hypothetical protein